MTGLLDGKVALVTGAAGGLGRVMVKGLIEAGAKVMGCDVNEDGLTGLASEIGSTALATQKLDISDQAQCAAAVASSVRRFGRLDILLNNGALGMGAIREDHFDNLVGIEEITPAMWDRFMAVNLAGPWYMTRAAVAPMKRQQSGTIINVTTSFFTMLRGGFHPYGPLKAGLEAMSAGHADEFRKHGIDVSVVVPGGPADTPMVPASSGLAREALVAPAAMLGPILWLCSGDGAGVSGNRYVAANWKAGRAAAENRASAESPIAWPDLAQAPVWPGGRPKD